MCIHCLVLCSLAHITSHHRDKKPLRSLISYSKCNSDNAIIDGNESKEEEQEEEEEEDTLQESSSEDNKSSKMTRRKFSTRSIARPRCRRGRLPAASSTHNAGDKSTAKTNKDSKEEEEEEEEEEEDDLLDPRYIPGTKFLLEWITEEADI